MLLSAEKVIYTVRNYRDTYVLKLVNELIDVVLDTLQVARQLHTNQSWVSRVAVGTENCAVPRWGGSQLGGSLESGNEVEHHGQSNTEGQYHRTKRRVQVVSGSFVDHLHSVEVHPVCPPNGPHGQCKVHIGQDLG